MVSTPPQSGDPGILGAGGARHYWMLADADAADADGEVGGPSRGPRRAENVNYNGNRYFYHSDHLGSSSLITDASGNVTQQLDYLPYGEVFLEKRADVDYHTPYKFNGKELDEETGLYYYGARYMNPRLSIWYGCDSEQELMPNISTYCYTIANPTNSIDPDGNLVLFVNGYYNTRDNIISENVIGQFSGEKYWSPDFVNAAKDYLNDNNVCYIDGRGSWSSSGEERFKSGYRYAQENYLQILSMLNSNEKINVVSHSMGAAFSEGIIMYLLSKGVDIGSVIHLSPADPSGFIAHAQNTIQLQINNDPVLAYKNVGESYIIKGVSRFGIVKTNCSFSEDFLNSHALTKLSPLTWKYVKALASIQLKYSRSETTTISVGSPMFPRYVQVTSKYYNGLFSNGIVFKNLMINGQHYNSTKSNEYISR